MAFFSIGFVLFFFNWCLFKIFYFYFNKKINKKIQNTNFYKILNLDKINVENQLLEQFHQFILNNQTQLFFKEKIDNFIKNEFSVVANFIGFSMIEKLKTKVMMEIANISLEIKQNHIQLKPLKKNIENMVNIILKKNLIDKKNELNFTINIYIFFIALGLSIFNTVIFILIKKV